MNQTIKQSMKFADLIFQKCSEPVSFFRFLCEIELTLQSCALFCRQLLQIEARNRGTETLLRRPRKPLYPKKKSFAPEIVFKPEFTRFPTCYTSQLLDDDDDVVDMMVRMLPMTIVCNSEVFLPNFL